MISARTWLALAVWAVGVALGCHGCEERAKDEPASVPPAEEPEMVGIDIPMEPQSLLLDPRLMELGGPVDFENRYRAAVRVSAVVSEEVVLRCSGTALSRHVVLTAGHGTIHHGRAHPHPEFKAIRDEREHVVFSHADLAVIILSKPLEFPGLPLSDNKVQIGDLIVIAGHEYDEVEGVFGEERRFSMNTMAARNWCGSRSIRAHISTWSGCGRRAQAWSGAIRTDESALRPENWPA